MNISKIKVGSTTYNLKDSNAISLNTISSWAQAGNSDTIPSSKLPSYVDDVLEYASTSSFPETGESGKIYVATDTNKTYRWGGSSYVVISETIAIGTTQGTAYDGAAGAALKSKLDGIEAGAQTHRAPSAAEVKTALGTGSGTTKYLREDGTWATPPDTNTWPTATSQLTNDSGYITGITSAMVTSALGYTPPSSDTNTVTSINGKTGAIAAADMAAVLTAAGYALTDTNTWPSYTSQLTNDSGYITSSGSCNYANSAGSASSATSAGYANQLQAFTEDNFTGGDHFVKAIRSSDGWSTRLWMCYNGGAAQSNAVQVSYADSAGYASSAGSAPASDVYSWAKLSSKPSYSYSEISGRPTKLSDLTNDVGYITSYTDTNTWRPITNTYTGSDQSTSVSQYGTNALYNALVNGYASSAGTAATLSKDSGLIANWRTGYDAYLSGLYYHTAGNEAVVFANKNSVTSWIFATTNPNDVTDWTTLTPSLQIKNQRVAINKLIANGADGSYNLDVNGSINGTSIYVNGTAVLTGITKAMVTNALGYTPPTSDTNTWRGITDSYSGTDSATSLSLKGGNTLYNALVNGYASNAGNADTLDGYHYNNLPYLTSHQDISGKVDKTSGNRPGVYRLYRRDDDSVYNVQTSWDGSRWLLRGYYGDDYHAPCRTEYADYAASAGSAPASDVYSWAKQSSKPSYSYSEISGTPGSLPASDVYSWAKASSKPGYSYGEISYGTWTGTTSGALSLDLSTYPLYCITLNGNVSSVSMSAPPAASHSGHVIFYNTSSSDYTVNIAHQASGSIKCPDAKDMALTVKAGGYAEIDILHVGNVAYFVRGV